MKTLITEADKKILIAQEDYTLAEWYCELNCWRWPVGLPDPEPVLPSPCRASHIMDWIFDMVGYKLVSRVWNKKMTDEEHEDFWKATMEKDPAARIRYNAYLKRRSEEHERLRSSGAPFNSDRPEAGELK